MDCIELDEKRFTSNFFQNLLLCMYSEWNKVINILDVQRSRFDFFNEEFYPRFEKIWYLIPCQNKQI